MEKKIRTLNSSGLKYEEMSMDAYERLMSDLDRIENVSELDEEQVAKLKEKMKQIEGTLKDKIKPKTITISGNLHSRIKKYCSDNSYNIGDWSEMALNKEMNFKPKRLETNLLQNLEEYRKKLSKNLKVIKTDLGESQKVNRVNDIIFDLKNQMWEERENMRTIKFNLSYLKELDETKIEDYLHRKYPKNLFIVNIKNENVSKKLDKMSFGEGAKFNINESGEVIFRKFQSLTSPGLYKRMVFEFNKDTFDMDMPFECQIQNIFGVNISKDDYYLSPESYL